MSASYAVSPAPVPAPSLQQLTKEIKPILGELHVTCYRQITAQELVPKLMNLRSYLRVRVTRGGQISRVADIFTKFARCPERLPDPLLRMVVGLHDQVERPVFEEMLSSAFQSRDAVLETWLNCLNESEEDAVLAQCRALVDIYGVRTLREAESKNESCLLNYTVKTGSLELLQFCRQLYKSRWDLRRSRVYKNHLHDAIATGCEDFFRAFLTFLREVDGEQFTPKITAWCRSNSVLCWALREGHGKMIPVIVAEFCHQPQLMESLFLQRYQGDNLFEHLPIMRKWEELDQYYQLMLEHLPKARERVVGSLGKALYTAVTDSDPRAMVVMQKILTEEEQKTIACSGHTLFHHAVCNGAITENILQCYHLVGPELSQEVLNHLIYRLDWLTKGALALNHLAFFEALLEIGSRELLQKALGPDQEKMSLLHQAARYKNGASISGVIALYKKFCPELLPLALLPDFREHTPVHYMIYCGGPRKLRELLHLVKELGGEAEAATLYPPSGKLSMLNYIWAGSSIRRDAHELTAVIADAIRELWPEAVDQLMLVGDSTAWALVRAIHYRNTAAVKTLVELLKLAKPETVNASLPALRVTGHWDSQRVYRSEIVPLLKPLFLRASEEAMVGAFRFQKEAEVFSIPAVQDILKDRFENPKQCLRFFLKVCLRQDASLPRHHVEANPYLSPLAAHPWILLLSKASTKELGYVLPAIATPLSSRALTVSQKASRAKDRQKRDELTQLCRRLIDWQRRVTIALVLCDVENSQVEPLLPFLLRLRDLAQSELRHGLTIMMGTRGLLKPLEDFLQWMPDAAGGKQPCLYLIPLMAMRQAGIAPDLIESYRERIAAMGSRAYEGSSYGKRILDSLYTLSSTPQLDDSDREALLRLALTDDWEKRLLALAQIIDMGPVESLKGFDGDLEAHLTQCFRRLIPIADVPNFSDRYEALINSQRQPESLHAYAAKVSRYKATLTELGTWLTSVLNGSFLEKRYAPHNSEHLAALYSCDTRLREALPNLCRNPALPPITLGEEGGIVHFPFGREQVDDKVRQDEMLPKEQFPHIWAYLEAEDDEQRRAARIKLGEARKTLGRPNPKDSYPDAQLLPQLESFLKMKGHEERPIAVLELINEGARLALTLAEREKPNTRVQLLALQLQDQLIKLCSLSDPAALQTALATSIKIAWQLAFYTAAPVSTLATELLTAWQTLKDSQESSSTGYKVFLTDHYWDLLRLGTDVSNSCQHLTLSSGVHRCLMGYVMSGHVIPIVAKKDGSEYIQARRLLLVLIDRRTHTPALFLEKAYWRSAHEDVDRAMVRMAKSVAEELQLPLYRSYGRQASRAELHSYRTAAKWIYSDAARGGKEGPYSIPRAYLIYKPGSGSGAASSSSASRGAPHCCGR